MPFLGSVVRIAENFANFADRLRTVKIFNANICFTIQPYAPILRVKWCTWNFPVNISILILSEKFSPANISRYMVYPGLTKVHCSSLLTFRTWIAQPGSLFGMLNTQQHIITYASSHYCARKTTRYSNWIGLGFLFNLGKPLVWRLPLTLWGTQWTCTHNWAVDGGRMGGSRDWAGGKHWSLLPYNIHLAFQSTSTPNNRYYNS